MRVVSYAPLLGEISFDTKKLRIFGLEERLTLFIEATTTQHIKERNQIARLFDSGFPADGVVIFCGTGINIGIAHLGHKVIGH